jgi:hypothetical protein
MMNIKADRVFVGSEARFILIIKFICENPRSWPMAGASVKSRLLRRLQRHLKTSTGNMNTLSKGL